LGGKRSKKGFNHTSSKKKRKCEIAGDAQFGRDVELLRKEEEKGMAIPRGRSLHHSTKIHYKRGGGKKKEDQTLDLSFSIRRASSLIISDRGGKRGYP